MGEYVQALCAIWHCWENAAPLKGEHYNFTLMTPAFSPPPTVLPMVPITIAAVGPAMLRLAGRHCDGARLHAFCTGAYAEQVVVPEINKGLSQSGRKRENFEVAGGGFIVTGPDEAALAKGRERVRRDIGFYGSTPAYPNCGSMTSIIPIGGRRLSCAASTSYRLVGRSNPRPGAGKCSQRAASTEESSETQPISFSRSRPGLR
jgi:alkanesulfonate monooxygenase SsuD/methylene tetrahydromethanopterin reductase-like flavin-dependent oxidoreductase (luciferase family)